MEELVSIIITTHYRNKPLQNAIKSALNQEYQPIEVIVIDDSGERYAEPVVQKYDVQYVAHKENMGQVSGWQTGLRVASGDYIQFLDDDDILKEQKISEQVKILRDQPDTGVAYCGVERQDGFVNLPPENARGDVEELMLQINFSPAQTSTLLMERKCLDRISPLPDYQAGTDIPLRIELAQITKFDFVNEPLVKRRVEFGTQATSLAAIDARERMLNDYEDLYENYPERVRQEAIANVSRFQGLVYLNHSIWSRHAIACFWREIRTDPNTDTVSVGRFLASIFGSPGIDISEKCFDFYTSR
ncbi:glycosyltransferase family 2 protein [Halobellus limi]|uniref:Glycosyl transferase family 2 n=1 Tax=Halobellus limi TaxID=699433 RepID=A0A1H5TXV7_9EURY|nr:glycosyltransferase family 2 protein [Halobellus limi]QCC47206.1 glycosyltransferase family 2 protein [Halobellus limi]SEF67613.1 Glycosyl transferase family 2 [Halobellus limi]